MLYLNKSFSILKNFLILKFVSSLFFLSAYAQDLHTFNHNGVEREYYLHLPESLPTGSPLVFVFHGYGSNASNIMGYSNMNDVADENNFAVCYPQGTTDIYGERFWNVGYEFHSSETVDDLGFILELSQFLEMQYFISRNNIFSTGMSNGGDFSYLIACEAFYRFQAIAPVAGTMMTWIFNSCQPNEPLSVFEIHGTNDNITLWEGDIDNSEGWGSYMGINSIINFWEEQNNCQLFSSDTLENESTSDGSFIVSETYSNCIYSNVVRLYKIINGGHDWPGAFGNMDIDSSEEIWEFFEQNMIFETIGDVNFDSLINVQDLLHTIDYINSVDQFYFLYDFDQDFDVNSMDVIAMIDYLFNF